MKRFLIIDAFGIIYRYYYIFIKNPLLNPEGENTSAVFGFLRTYFSLLESYPSDYTCIALDSTRETFRNEIYPEYKANREHMPEDLKAQIPMLMEIIEALSLPYLRFDGYEADDIIGTVSELNKKNGVSTIIYSPDKDILQLVDENTRVINSAKDGSMNEFGKDEVKEKRGVEPTAVIDLLAIMGDASDNIPGVKGIGEKGALKLLNEFGSLEEIYDNIESIRGKTKEKLIDNKENAFLSKTLATIKKDIDFDFSYQSFERKEPDSEKTFELIEKLGLKQLEKKVREYYDIKEEQAKTEKEFEKRKTISKKDAEYYLIENETELTNLLKEIAGMQFVCVDFETTGLDTFNDKIIGIAFSVREGEALYLDLSGRTSFEYDATMEKVFSALNKEGVKIIGQNLKYEYKMAKAAGYEMKNLYFDTMIASYLINPQNKKHNFDKIAFDYLGHTTIKYSDLTDGAEKNLTQVDLKLVVDYAGEDADITFRLYKYLDEQLKQMGLERLFHELEMPLVRTIALMEYEGLLVDTGQLKALSEEYRKIIEGAEQKIIEEVGEEFNPASPKQVAWALFEKLKLPAGKKTKTGFSTDEEVLKELALHYNVATKLLEYRKYSKLKNTYVDVYPKLLHEKTKRIHGSFHQTVTSTGRLSSSDPNLQNIPIKDEDGRKIRRAIIPAQGNSMISADYSQIELRLLAHFCQDDNLIEAYKNGEDIHSKTAMKIFSVSKKHVTRSMRNTAKIINFSIIYGKTAFGLSKELKISRKEAQEFIDNYFAGYPKVKDFEQSVIDEAKEKGFVETIFGRKRSLPNLHSRNVKLRNEAQRFAVNTLIQGSAADLIKLAMVKLQKEFDEKHPDSKLLLQVHDELVIETPADKAEEVTALCKECMEGALELNVPLVVDIHHGSNWGDIH